MIMIFSGAMGLILMEKNEAVDADEATRGDVMGEWEELPTGGWPSGISTDDCYTFYRDNSNEIVVINRGYYEFEIWSFFENNETWIKSTTSGDDPDRRWTYKAFTSSTNGSYAYLFGGYRQSSSSSDKLNIFCYDNKTWLEIDPHPNLGGRYWAEMVYDDATESVWIFGGRESSARQSDLFQWNFTDGWTEHSAIGLEDEERDHVENDDGFNF